MFFTGTIDEKTMALLLMNKPCLSVKLMQRVFVSAAMWNFGKNWVGP